MATTDLVTKKINYTLEKKAEITDIVGLSGNPTWDTIIDSINNPAGQITNVSINSSRVASWTAPTINVDSSLNPSVSYLMYVNGTYIGETTSTSYDLTNYLVEGQNTFSVKARIEFNNKDLVNSGNTITITASYSVTYQYVSGYMYQSGNQMPVIACNGEKVYILSSLTNSVSSKLTKENNEITATNITEISRPTNYDFVGYSAYATVGNICYIFGRGTSSASTDNKIAKFNIESETISLSNATVPTINNKYSKGMAVAKGTDIYIFGGTYDSGNNYKIFKYDTLTDTITTMTAETDAQIRFSNGIVVGDYIYLITYDYSDGNTMQRYNIQTDTIETLINDLKTSLSVDGYMPTYFVKLDNEIYLTGRFVVGGYLVNKIFKLNTATNQFTDATEQFNISASYVSYWAANKGVFAYNSNLDEQILLNDYNHLMILKKTKNVSV